MKYFTQIEAFFSKKMTGAGREAFEHETADNADLAGEVDAYQMAADLFDFTADNLSDEQILSPEERATPSKMGSRSVIIIAGVVLVLLFLFLGYATFHKQNSPPIQPVEEKEQPPKDIPVAEYASPQSASDEPEQLTAMVETGQSKIVNESPSQPTEIEDALPNSRALPSDAWAGLEKSEYEETIVEEPSASTKLTSNASIGSGEKIVFQAGQQITLTAGFHAKAGSSFKAVVKNN